MAVKVCGYMHNVNAGDPGRALFNDLFIRLWPRNTDNGRFKLISECRDFHIPFFRFFRESYASPNTLLDSTLRKFLTDTIKNKNRAASREHLADPSTLEADLKLALRWAESSLASRVKGRGPFSIKKSDLLILESTDAETQDVPAEGAAESPVQNQPSAKDNMSWYDTPTYCLHLVSSVLLLSASICDLECMLFWFRSFCV